MSQRRRSGDSSDEESRSARDLVASGPSQIDRARAMRVRDVNRPTADDMSDAEETLRIVHRNWKPLK